MVKRVAMINHIILHQFAALPAGSGFFIDLPANKSHASSMLRDLHVWRWVDKLTRALLDSSENSKSQGLE